MKIISNVAAVILLLVSPSVLAQSTAVERWTGGFWLDGNWVAVNVRFDRQRENPGGTADILLPTYGGSDNAINVALESVRETPAGIHFEIPTRTTRVVFDGHQKNDTISGSFAYDQAKGAFGLTRVANVTLELLEKYYGDYRVSSDRVISIFRGWSLSRTLNYVDYKSGQVGTLWPAAENEFFSGAGLAVSFPVAVKVTFDSDGDGRIRRLLWKSPSEPKMTAQKIEFEEERITFKNGGITLGGTLIFPPYQTTPSSRDRDAWRLRH